MKFRKNSIFMLLVTALLLTSLQLSSCSGRDTNAGAKADSLQRVIDAGALTVVGSGGFPPFNFIDDNGDVIGFDVDVGREIASRLGVELNYVTGEWSGLIEGLRNGRYDAILGSMAITDERLKSVNFTQPYYYSGAQLVVNSDSGIADPDQMSGGTIAVVTATNYMEDAEKLGAEVKMYDDDNSTLLELRNGRVDGVITDKMVVLIARKNMEGGSTLTLAGDVLRSENIGIAVNKEDDELLEAVDKILAEMHEDGTLSRISEKWLGADVTTK